MLDLKIRKFGNSLGVIIPKEMLEALNAGEGDILQATKSDAGGFQIRAEDAAFTQQMEIAREAMEKYKNTLKKLAE